MTTRSPYSRYGAPAPSSRGLSGYGGYTAPRPGGYVSTGYPSSGVQYEDYPGTPVAPYTGAARSTYPTGSYPTARGRTVAHRPVGPAPVVSRGRSLGMGGRYASSAPYDGYGVCDDYDYAPVRGSYASDYVAPTRAGYATDYVSDYVAPTRAYPPRSNSAGYATSRAGPGRVLGTRSYVTGRTVGEYGDYTTGSARYGPAGTYGTGVLGGVLPAAPSTVFTSDATVFTSGAAALTSTGVLGGVLPAAPSTVFTSDATVFTSGAAALTTTTTSVPTPSADIQELFKQQHPEFFEGDLLKTGDSLNTAMSAFNTNTTPAFMPSPAMPSPAMPSPAMPSFTPTAGYGAAPTTDLQALFRAQYPHMFDPSGAMKTGEEFNFAVQAQVTAAPAEAPETAAADAAFDDAAPADAAEDYPLPPGADAPAAPAPPSPAPAVAPVPAAAPGSAPSFDLERSRRIAQQLLAA